MRRMLQAELMQAGLGPPLVCMECIFSQVSTGQGLRMQCGMAAAEGMLHPPIL